jgi:phosphomannomutase
MSKIKFGTDGWRAIIGDQFTVENLLRVVEGTALWVKQHHNAPEVMIGHDCRFNGSYFSRQAAMGFASQGVKVFLAPSFASTPMVSLAVHKRQIDLGIVITASHNPPEYSGYKLKGAFGGPLAPDQIAQVEALIPETASPCPDRFDEFVAAGLIAWFDMEALYLNHVKDQFDLKLIRNSGIAVGYDAMYGAGQQAFRKLLPNATLLHCDFNPSFHGTAPEPIERNLGEFQSLIREKGLAIGIATDGDADRIGLFDEEGTFVDSHHILLLLIHYLHKVRGLEGKVVITFSVSPKVEKLCKLYGIPYQVTPIGFKYVCEIMLHENVIVGGEESGGIAIAGHVPERDGIYIGLTILEMMARSGKKLTALIQEMYDLVGAFSFRRSDLHLKEEEKQRILADLKAGKHKALGAFPIHSTSDMDGWKFFLDDDQWVMVRASGTEPVLRIYGESSTAEQADALIAAAIATLLG